MAGRTKTTSSTAQITMRSEMIAASAPETLPRALVAVIPGKRRHDGQAEREQDDHDAGHDVRPFEGLGDELGPVRERQRRREIGKPPLQDFVLFDPRP